MLFNIDLAQKNKTKTKQKKHENKFHIPFSNYFLSYLQGPVKKIMLL